MNLTEMARNTLEGLHGHQTDDEFLAEYFEFEVCDECGCDERRHTVSVDVFGNLQPFCLWPIDFDMPDAMEILEARMRHNTEMTL